MTLRVVVIDDQVDTRDLMSIYLRTHLPSSIRVHAVGDVGYREGICWDEVAVAIIDVMMPNVDGREIMAWLRDERPEIHRIAWTAAVDNYREELTANNLAHAVVAKPGLEELIHLVRPFVHKGVQ